MSVKATHRGRTVCRGIGYNAMEQYIAALAITALPGKGEDHELLDLSIGAHSLGWVGRCWPDCIRHYFGRRRCAHPIELRWCGGRLSAIFFAGTSNGERVIIDGPCFSACTLVLSTAFASLPGPCSAFTLPDGLIPELAECLQRRRRHGS